MTPYIAPLHATPFEIEPVRAAPRREAEIIAGRIASARRWRRRRTALRLRAAVFGRRRRPGPTPAVRGHAGPGPAPQVHAA